MTHVASSIRRLAGAVLAAAALSLAPSALLADATADLVKVMRDLEKSGDEQQCVDKIVELKDSEDPRVLTAMKDFVKSKSDKIACAAMNWITVKRDSEFWKWLVARIDDKDLYRRKDGRPEVYKTLLEDVGQYLKDNQDKSVLKPLEDVVKRHLATDSEYSTRAVRAYGAVRDVAVVDALIDWLDVVDARAQTSSGKNESAEARKHKDEAKKAVVETLTSLVGPDIPDSAGWKKYWDEHRRGFVFPDPHKKPADVDVTKLREWTDVAYGYHVKLPAGAEWAFVGKDQWFRIQALKQDDKKMWWCWAAWGTQKIDAKIKDAKAYAEWWAYEEFGKTAAEGKEFEEFAAGGEPKIDEKKFAGREWAHVAVKGKAKGAFVNWGVMEKHVYVTKLDWQLLYAVATVRTGAEPEDKTKTWQFVEGVTFVK